MQKLLIFILLIISFSNAKGQNEEKATGVFDAQEMIDLVNAARMEKRRCGGQMQAATHPLVWNDTLASAAQKHARDMAENDFFDHTGSDGSTLVIRVEREEYQWSAVGENVAWGPRSVMDVVQGWLDSPGHCSNIMSSEFTEMGAAFDENGNYWVQVFGKPRSYK
jgi:uncharacterized protein YkwD